MSSLLGIVPPAPFLDNFGNNDCGFLYRLFSAEALKRVNPDNICELVAQQYAYDCGLQWAKSREYAIEFYRRNKPLLARYLCDRYTGIIKQHLIDLENLGTSRHIAPFPYDEAFVNALMQNLIDGLNRPDLMKHCLYHEPNSTTRHHDVAFDVEVLDSTVLGIWSTYENNLPPDCKYHHEKLQPVKHHRHGAGVIIDIRSLVKKVSEIITTAIDQADDRRRLNFKNIGHILSILYRLYKPIGYSGIIIARLDDMLSHFLTYHNLREVGSSVSFSRRFSNHSLEIITWDALMKDTDNAVSLMTSGEGEKPVTISVCYMDRFQENYLTARYIYEQDIKSS